MCISDGGSNRLFRNGKTGISIQENLKRADDNHTSLTRTRAVKKAQKYKNSNLGLPYTYIIHFSFTSSDAVFVSRLWFPSSLHLRFIRHPTAQHLAFMCTFIKGDLDLLKELGSREARHRRAWDRESAIKRAGFPDATGKIYVVLDINRQGIL